MNVTLQPASGGSGLSEGAAAEARMSTCVSEPPTLWAIVTYAGSSLDIYISYFAAAVMLCATAAATLRRPSGRQQALAGASVALSIVVAFQLGLCLCLGCTGISVVWNAAAGYVLITDVLQGAPGRRLLLAAMLVCALVDVYYSITAELLTTIAHGCALLLGAAFGGVHVCANPRLQSHKRGWTRLTDAAGSSGPEFRLATPVTRSNPAAAASPCPLSGPVAIDSRLLQLLRHLTADTPPVALKPFGFFIAWHGVLVLAWRGFPNPLSDLKPNIEQGLAALSSEDPAAAAALLKAEGAGSKWPKISLAAVNDAAPPLSISQLRTLKGICLARSAALCRHSGPDQAVPAWPVSSLSAVAYSWRSLERVDVSIELPLGQGVATAGHSSAGAEGQVAVGSEGNAAAATSSTFRNHAQANAAHIETDLSSQIDAGVGCTSAERHAAAAPVRAVRAADAATVAAVMREWGVEEEYLPHVNKPGSRLRSYREGSPSGATLVAFLTSRQQAVAHTPGDGGKAASNRMAAPRADTGGGIDSAILPALREFRAAVDAALPGVYSWFEEGSLHCTVRSLDEESLKC
jgi:hypothetical protein